MADTTTDPTPESISEFSLETDPTPAPGEALTPTEMPSLVTEPNAENAEVTNPKLLALVDRWVRFRKGQLTYTEYQKLPRLSKRAYRRRWGRPKSPEELRGRARTVARRRARNRLARVARAKSR